MTDKIAILFPAFGMKYTGKEQKIINDNHINISPYFKRAAHTVPCDGEMLEKNRDGIINDELQSQYLNYIYSCIFSDILKDKKIKPDFVAGYSMGLYASLYHANSLTFEQGLLIIKKAYDLLIHYTQDKRYSMCGIIGLSISDIEKIITSNNLQVEVINKNNEFGFTVCGEEKQIDTVIQSANQIGALKTMLLPVKACYHTHYAQKASNPFKTYLSTCHIKGATIPLVSSSQVGILRNKDEINDELIRNLTNHLNWEETMRFLIKENSKIFIECGPGNSLSRIARFIQGDFKVRSIDSL